MKTEHISASRRLGLTALVALLVALAIVMPAKRTWAAVDCSTATAGTTIDSDGDGLTDFEECTGITLADGTLVPNCAVSRGSAAGCLDPNRKDVFVVVVPASSGSLLPAGFNPFTQVFTNPNTGASGTAFAALGVTAHQITAAQAIQGRTVPGVSSAGTVVASTLAQKAVRVTESLDTTASTLGQCNWGTPDGLDGCVVYTQRIQNLINSNCQGNTATDRQQAFNTYTTHTFIHEAGHSLGGLTASYDSRYGGNHYPAMSSSRSTPVMMEQFESYTVSRSGVCAFNYGKGFALPVNADGTTGWNTTLDPSSVLLK